MHLKNTIAVFLLRKSALLAAHRRRLLTFPTPKSYAGITSRRHIASTSTDPHECHKADAGTNVLNGGLNSQVVGLERLRSGMDLNIKALNEDTIDSTKIEVGNIPLTASNSHAQCLKSNLYLAGHEEFDHLKEGMAKMKATFMDAQNEILGLRQILNSQQAVDDCKGRNDGMNVIARKVTPDDVERSLQALEMANRNAKCEFRQVERKFFKAMEEIDKFAAAVATLQPLKFDLVNTYESVEEKMIDLDSQIKLFKEGLADHLSKVRPAIDQEVVTALTGENDALQLLIGKLESKHFMVDEEIKNLKQSAGNVSWRIEDEVDKLCIEFDRCKATAHYVILDQKYIESKTVSKGYELQRALSSMESRVFEKRCAIVQALKEHNKLENITESGHIPHNYTIMLKRMKSVLKELDTEIKKLHDDIHDAINKKYYDVHKKVTDESDDEGDEEEEDDKGDAEDEDQNDGEEDESN